MRRLLFAIGLSVSGALLPLPLAGQTPLPIPAASPPLPAPWKPALPAAPLVRPAASRLVPEARVTGRRKDHTLIGLFIGAALGLLGGYAFYDIMCEAVDNRCAGSRVPHLVIGGAVGGGLGALIGSLAD